MLHHFLLIFPTGFEGVLATYHTAILLTFFPQGFWRRVNSRMIPEMVDCKDKEGLGGVLGLN